MLLLLLFITFSVNIIWKSLVYKEFDDFITRCINKPLKLVHYFFKFSITIKQERHMHVR